MRIRVDGGLKTGRDVVAAALLGADEYSFGTAALVAQGCIMVRTCHLDTCPTGIATQRPDLRAKFAGTPEMVIAYTAVAEDVRARLPSLGLRSMDEAIGRTDLLRQRSVAGRAGRLDLSGLLDVGDGERRFLAHVPFQRQRSELGDRLFEEAWPAVTTGRRVRLRFPITTGDRAVGARLGGEIGRRFGEASPPGLVEARFEGQAGQSFGAFLSAGVELHLRGEANDYVGKGMGGGRIVIAPPAGDAGDPYLLGNTVLYGATGGELHVAGRVGERFAVRNCGATAVVEGAGQHACEYMTGGTVVALGPVGQNLGAGMTGGVAYVWDPAARLPAMVNPELVDARRPVPEEMLTLQGLVRQHADLTGSERAEAILADWPESRHAFCTVAPKSDAAAISRTVEGTLRSART